MADTIRDHAGGRAIVVGLSLGGYVAMALAARDPARVRGLVLSGATAEPVGVRMLPYLALASRHGRHRRGRPGPPQHLVLPTPLPGGHRRARSSPAGSGRDGGAVALRAIAGERFVPRLAAYPGPTLIINGSRDLPFRLFAPTFAAAAHDARRVRLAGASHLANLDRPAAFTEAVRRFARSLEPA